MTIACGVEGFILFYFFFSLTLLNTLPTINFQVHDSNSKLDSGVNSKNHLINPNSRFILVLIMQSTKKFWKMANLIPKFFFVDLVPIYYL